MQMFVPGGRAYSVQGELLKTVSPGRNMSNQISYQKFYVENAER